VVFEPMKLPTASQQGRVQAYDGPIHRRRRALPQVEESGARHHRPYALTDDQYKPRSMCCASSIRSSQVLARCDRETQDSKRSVVASDSWPYQVNTLVANKQPIASTIRRRHHGMGGHHDDAAQAKHPNCAYKWMEWSVAEGAG